MKIFSSTVAKTASVLAFSLCASAMAQDFCSTGTHSGTSKKTNGNVNGDQYQEISKIGDFAYELWYRGGNGASSATFYSDGSMKCSAVNSDDYLCRSGLSFGSDKLYTQLDHMYADFKVSMSGQKNIGYSFVGIYGWSKSPMIEFYIVDNWASQYKPGGTGWGWTKKGEYTLDGDLYEAWVHRQINQWSLDGMADFDQFYSVRKTARSCGTIDITGHFEQWDKLGMKLGKMYEAKILGEVGNGSGVASCEFDFPVARVYTGTPSSPASSSSEKPSSSSSSSIGPLTGGTAVPGTIEFEDYEKASDEVTIYGSAVGEIAPGYWLEYTIDVAQDGVYDFEILAAREDADGNASGLTLSIDGTDVGTASVLSEGWDDYKTFTGTTKEIKKGSHILRVTFDYGYLNVDNIKFTASGNTAIASMPRMNNSARTIQVFDMQGRFMASIHVAAGVALNDAVSSKVAKPGMYLVRQGNMFQKIVVRQ